MSYIYYTIYSPLGHILKVVQDNYSRPNGKWYTIKTLDNNSHHTSGPGRNKLLRIFMQVAIPAQIARKSSLA